MMKAFRSPTANRLIFALICLMITLTGAGNLLHGRMDYQNYKGFPAFAPFAILLGALGLVAVIWRPATFTPDPKKNHRSPDKPPSPTHSHRKCR
jgi:hypothetical protein